ncbi:MAG: rod shape-determining protein MreC [bacterium]
MYRRKQISPWRRVIIITAILLVVVIVLGRLDFPGRVLRFVSNIVPSKPPEAYTLKEINEFRDNASHFSSENAILKDMLSECRGEQQLGKVDFGYPLLKARIIYRDHAGLFETAVIDKGSADGVELQMPVVDANGLVGRVVSVRGALSRIILITGPDCSFGVFDERSRDTGVVNGTEPVHWRIGGENDSRGNIMPPGLLELRYLSPSADISVKDRLLTSGYSGITPRGIPVGEVVEIISHQEQGVFDIRVRPFADIEHVEVVGVVLYGEKDYEQLQELVGETGKTLVPPDTE